MPGLMLTGRSLPSGGRTSVPTQKVFAVPGRSGFVSIPKVVPFLRIIGGVGYALYGGVATPSEAAGVGAALCMIMAIVILCIFRDRDLVAGSSDGPSASSLTRSSAFFPLAYGHEGTGKDICSLHVLGRERCPAMSLFCLP